MFPVLRCKQSMEKKVDSLWDDGVDMPDIVILPVYAQLPTVRARCPSCAASLLLADTRV